MERIDHLWSTYKNIQDIIKFADQKIQILLAINSIFSTYVINIVLNNKYIFWPDKIFIACYFIALLSFIIISLSALWARKDITSVRNDVRSIYFGHISKYHSADKFYDLVKELNSEDIIRNLAFQIFEVSRIASTKFKYYNLSWIILMVQLGIFFCMILGKLL